LDGDLEGPCHFVNLLAFREVAESPWDHEPADHQISGAEASDKYGMVALEHVRKRGGRLITLNDVKTPVIGCSRHWHRVAAMEYRNINTFIDMLMNSDYQAALVH
jgi:hypothetical protein